MRTVSPIHDDADANTLTIRPGVRLAGVPKLSATQILVADVSALYLVQTEDFTIEMNDQYAFANDAVALRVKARLNVAAPTPDKSMRQAKISPPAGP